jgi:hypothetical protein
MEVTRKMRSWVIAAPFALAGLLLPPTAHAVNLTNEDSVAYRILVVDQAGKREVLIAPGEMLWDICYRCDITLKDVDTISAEPTDTVSIQNGKLSVLS